MKTLITLFVALLVVSTANACNMVYVPRISYYSAPMIYAPPTVYGGVYSEQSALYQTAPMYDYAVPDYVAPGLGYVTPSYSRTLIRYGYNRNLFFAPRGNVFFNDGFSRTIIRGDRTVIRFRR